MNLQQDIIIAPIISEKSMRDAGQGRFTFKVAGRADKKSVKKAIEEKFKVNVLQTYISLVKGKRNKVGRQRMEVNVTPWKKATVKLEKDQKIGLFDTGGKNNE